jgi:hypothetical protein
VEYQSPKNPRSTFGAVVYNVFNNLYSRPALNQRYQPVATGIAAPYSGYTSGATNPAFYGFRNYTAAQGNRAYIINQGSQPRRVNFYYQLNL